MTEYCVDIFTNGKHPKCVYTFCDYESAINYIAQNPLSSALKNIVSVSPPMMMKGWPV